MNVSYDVIDESFNVITEHFYAEEVGVVSISESSDKKSCNVSM